VKLRSKTVAKVSRIVAIAADTPIGNRLLISEIVNDREKIVVVIVVRTPNTATMLPIIRRIFTDT